MLCACVCVTCLWCCYIWCVKEKKRKKSLFSCVPEAWKAFYRDAVVWGRDWKKILPSQLWLLLRSVTGDFCSMSAKPGGWGGFSGSSSSLSVIWGAAAPCQWFGVQQFPIRDAGSCSNVPQQQTQLQLLCSAHWSCCSTARSAAAGEGLLSTLGAVWHDSLGFHSRESNKGFGGQFWVLPRDGAGQNPQEELWVLEQQGWQWLILPFASHRPPLPNHHPPPQIKHAPPQWHQGFCLLCLAKAVGCLQFNFGFSSQLHWCCCGWSLPCVSSQPRKDLASRCLLFKGLQFAYSTKRIFLLFGQDQCKLLGLPFKNLFF